MHVVLPVFTPTAKSLKESSAVYNQLPDDSDQPDIPQHHLQNIASIFLRFNVEHIFGLHLLHGHLKIGEDMIMLGKQFPEPLCWWTRPTNIGDINPKDVHGHIFKLFPDGRFLPYEYRTGPPRDLKNLDHVFYQELAQYLHDNHLAELLGLQLFDGPPKRMSEVVFDTGTAMLEASKVRRGIQGKITGWNVVHREGIVDFKGNETHYPPKEGEEHKYYYDGKLHTHEALLAFLKDKDII